MIVYLVIGAFATLCLLKKNDKGVTVIGDTSLVIMDNDVDNYYKKGDLVFIVKPDLKTVQVGEPILFYDTSFNKNTVTLSNVIVKGQDADSSGVVEDQTNNYTLVMNFPSSYNSFNYQDLFEMIEIQISARQVLSRSDN